MSAYREVAEAGWRWTLQQVRHDEIGAWLPGTLADREPPPLRAGVHSGVGGLGLALSEVRRSRAWTEEEARLAEEVVATVRRETARTTDAAWFDGLSGQVTALRALDADGVAPVVARLLELATDSGWASPFVVPPRFTDDGRCNDATLGTGAVLLAALDAWSDGVRDAAELAELAVSVLVAEVESTADGPTWPFVPHRYRTDPPREMPNWSHGAAGVATALARAATALHRPDLLELATAAATRLVRIGDTSDGGLRVPALLPGADDVPTFSYGWCHGPSGTAQVFTALADAGVREVAGAPPLLLRDRCWLSVKASGLPARLAPGFWDNDGRCCGTAGVGDLALDAGDVAFATVLGDACVARAERDGDLAWWRFVEHRADDPLLPPAPGWMQGSAGIAAFLLRLDRAIEAAGEARDRA